MKVGFDARMIDHPGIGSYIRNLLFAMSHHDDGIELVLYGDPEKLSYFKEMRVVRYTAPIYGLSELLNSPFTKGSLDIVHVPHFNAPLARVHNLVITIHDFIYLKLPESSTLLKRLGAGLVISKAIKNAQAIIAVSQNTKRDIIEDFPSAKDKVKVVYEAADPFFKKIDDEGKKESLLRKYNLGREIILYVGSLMVHKNIERLIDAYGILKKRGIKHKLVIAGRCKLHNSAILRKIEKSDAAYLGEIPVEDLLLLYNAASLFVLPSLYEGFGLPVLEAMSCGVPVAASSAASLPEVTQDAALLFDPLDVRDIAEKIYRVLSDDGLKQQLIMKGFLRVKSFSWEVNARDTLNLYRILMHSHRAS